MLKLEESETQVVQPALLFLCLPRLALSEIGACVNLSSTCVSAQSMCSPIALYVSSLCCYRMPFCAYIVLHVLCSMCLATLCCMYAVFVLFLCLYAHCTHNVNHVSCWAHTCSPGLTLCCVQGNNAISTGLTEALLEILVKFPSAELALVATELIDHLSSKDGDVRWGVLKVCWKLPADILAKSAPIMIAALSDSNADARRVAGKIVWKLPVDSLAQMLPQLLEALRKTTTSSDIRKEMTRLMFAPDRLPVQAVVDEIDVLIDWLEDPDAEIRHLAGDIIGRLPERDIIELVPDLTLMIDTYKDSNFKNAPLEILAKLPPKKLAQLAPDHAKMITFKHRNGSSKLGNRPNYLSLPELGPTHRNASQSRSTSAQN